jgi:tetraacyldisaccharide 4'-kinase
VPVVVVGNVVAGGAGKTPTALAIALHLKARGWRPGIVSRGYGRASGDCREVPPDADPRAAGDEPLLLRRRADVPVFVARRRADAGRALLAAYPDTDVLICDDGLQHLALAREVEVVVFDARGAGNGWLLPAGPLREPWPRRLPPLSPRGRGVGGEGLESSAAAPPPAQLILLTEPCPHLPLPPGQHAHAAQRALAAEAVRADGTRVPLVALQGQPLAAVAGIARPDAFFAMLRAAGLTLAEARALPDHFAFDNWRPPRGTLICTEKDAPKLWRHHPAALAAPLTLDVPPAFFAALDQALHAHGYHPRA